MAKALHKAATQMFGAAALIQRCQVHYADLRIMPTSVTDVPFAAVLAEYMSA